VTGPRLTIATLGLIRSDPGLPAWLGRRLPRALGIEPVAGPEIGLEERWKDPVSGVYDSNRIVDALVELLAPESADRAGHRPGWTLVLTEADLQAPGRPFVFGEATLGGPLAVVSIARLQSPDVAVLRRRALKEAAHEIGHLAGLDHCTDPRCVMFPSTDLPDTDAKRETLCAVCRQRHRPPPTP
jgi:archaemetzincin